MKEFKIKVELRINKDKTGVALQKLSAISDEINKFLIDLGEDCFIGKDNNIWFATNFHNSNLSFDIKNEQVDDDKLNSLHDNFNVIVNRDIASFPPGINPRTLDQYTKIADKIELDEEVCFGVYENSDDDSTIEWHGLTKNNIIDLVPIIKSREIVEYWGNICGRVHAWHKESDKPHLTVRELISGDLINCFYSDKNYSMVHELLKNKAAIVYISGNIKANRYKRKIVEIFAEKFIEAPGYRDGDLDKFIGRLPGLTGDLSSSEYINRIYDNE